MLRTFYGKDGVGPVDGAVEGARWIDLFDPSPDEAARAAACLDIALPDRAALSEIEASSRVRAEGDWLVMSAPLIARQPDGRSILVPTGFLLSRDRLVTIRYAELGAFDEVEKALVAGRPPHGGTRTPKAAATPEESEADGVSAAEIMVRLIEEIVDRAADRLERVAETLAEASGEIFAEPSPDRARRRKLGRETRRLRRLMVRIGTSNEELVRVRHCFLSVGRMASFLAVRIEPKGQGLRDRLKTARRDIESLDEFENSLAGRVGLLIDAATGFISIEQNDVVKVLTVASVAGVPPVVIAGIYGMNFKYMPELDWHIGYPLALAAMLVTTALPVAWFKWRDWL